MAHTTARHSFSTVAYLLSVVDRVQLAHSTTVPLEVDRTAPRLAPETSVVSINLSVCLG